MISRNQILGVFLFLAGIVGIVGVFISKNTGLTIYDMFSGMIAGIGLIVWSYLPSEIKILNRSK